MIERVSVQNFRCFDSLEVNDLKRINVIVGKNSSGKSAFMEALFMSSSSNAPNIAFQMRAIRKVGGQLQVPADALGFRSIWEDLFFNFDTDNKIHIQIRGSAGDQRQLRISFKDVSPQEIPYGKTPEANLTFPQIIFTWKRGGGKEITIKPKITSTGIEIGTMDVDHFPMIWFHAGGGDNADVTAKRFSELSKRNEAEPIIEAIKQEFSFVEDLSIEFLSGVPMLFASVRGMSQKVPAGLVSDGIQRLIGILLGIAYYKGGAVLIDQIEDGFYFDRFPSIWKSIHRFSKIYKTQLFVSTHSSECIKALGETLQANEADFNLLRAERADRDCLIKQFDGDTLLAAIRQKVEFR